MLLITEEQVQEIKSKADRLPKFMRGIAPIILLEGFATMILTYGICCSVYWHPFKTKDHNIYQAFLISSFLYFALSVAAPFSGGHLNPAVTIMMFIANKIEGKKVKYYILAQVIGALLGSTIAYFCFDIVPAPYIIEQDILSSLADTAGAVFGSFIFTFFTLYAIDTNYMRGQYFLYFFVSIMFLAGRIFTFRKSCINPAIGLAFQVYAAIDNNNYMLLFYSAGLIIGPIVGGVIAALFYVKFYYSLLNQLQNKPQ